MEGLEIMERRKFKGRAKIFIKKHIGELSSIHEKYDIVS